MPTSHSKMQAGSGAENTATKGQYRLLDAMLQILNLKNDAALARKLEVPPPVISRQRHGNIPIGPSMLLRMHEVTNLPVRELRAFMADDSDKTTLS